MSNKQLFAGIDLGGSKVYTVIAHPDGDIVASSKMRIPRGGSFNDVVTVIKECLNKTLDKSHVKFSQIEGLGIGVPGPVDKEGKIAFIMPNLGFTNVDVAGTLSKALSKEVYVENDTNLSTLSEYHLGAGKGSDTLYGIFIGTGVGAGYLVKGEIVRGRYHSASEIGHIALDLDGPTCSCGQSGCLEAFVSRKALVRELREALDQSEKSQLMDYSSDDFQSVTVEALKSAWESGDLLTRRLLTKQARILGTAIGGVVNLLGLERVVIGGKLYDTLGTALLPIVSDAASQRAIGNGMAGVQLVLSELKDNAVGLGAVLLAKSRTK